MDKQALTINTLAATVITPSEVSQFSLDDAAPSIISGDDYLTFDENNVVTGGRLNNQTVISFVQYERSGLTSWNIPLPKVSTAQQAFFNAGLTEWNIEMPELRNATSMLYGNKNMTALRAAFPNVELAVTMCYSCAKLEVVECTLKNLTNGRAAFCQCPKLTRANGYMPKLIDGEMLFSATPMRVVENANFSSLSNGFNLFNGGQLNKESALGVLNTIPSWSSETHKLVIGIHVDHQTDEDVLDAIGEAQSRGWEMTVQWNGTPTAQTSAAYGSRTQPIYARVEERNGEKILEWGHYVTDPTGYEEFLSVEEAQAHFGIEEERL